jgi:hypothetical protein
MCLLRPPFHRFTVQIVVSNGFILLDSIKLVGGKDAT